MFSFVNQQSKVMQKKKKWLSLDEKQFVSD